MKKWIVSTLAHLDSRLPVLCRMYIHCIQVSTVKSLHFVPLPASLLQCRLEREREGDERFTKTICQWQSRKWSINPGYFRQLDCERSSWSWFSWQWQYFDLSSSSHVSSI
eukprot:scaffold9252_cov160-Skeletonema_marinoi.AAC.7